MSIQESTTEHSPVRERRFAGKLYIAILAAILIAAVFSYSFSNHRNLNSQNLGERAQTIGNDPSGQAPVNTDQGMTNPTGTTGNTTVPESNPAPAR